MTSLTKIALTSALIAVALGNNLGELPGHQEDRNIYLLASTDVTSISSISSLSSHHSTSMSMSSCDCFDNIVTMCPECMPYFVNVPNQFKISADSAEQSRPVLLFPLMTDLTVSW